MSLLWADGFDHYGSVVAYLTQGPYAAVSGVTLTTADPGPRTGLRCARVSGGFNTGLRRVFGGDVDVAGVGFAFVLPSLPSDNNSVCLASFRDGGNNPTASLMVGSTGQLILKAGSGVGTVLSTSDPCVLAGSYQHFECRYEEATGSFEARINGVTRISVVGAAVIAGPTAQVQIGTSGQGTFGYPAYMGVDDLYAWDDSSGGAADFIGDKKVYTRFPASDGTFQDWIPSVGADGYAMLDNNPPNDAVDYLTALNVGSAEDRSEFGIAPFPVEVVSVAGVVIATRLFKTDAGDAKVQVGVISGAAEALGEEHALSMAPTWYHDVFETDPNTATVWSLAAVNALTESLTRTE
jgi:hypothetical protein